MTLQTSCIHGDKQPSEGMSISVMSRHTQSDGVTPDLEIFNHRFEWWFPDLGPPPKLVGAYYRGETSWSAFEVQYLEHIRKAELRDRLRWIAALASNRPVTLLCVEKEPDQCHRRLLAEELARLHSGLSTFIR